MALSSSVMPPPLAVGSRPAAQLTPPPASPSAEAPRPPAEPSAKAFKWRETTTFDTDLALQSADGGVEIVVPSQTMEPEISRSIEGIQLYEERALWNLASRGPAGESRPPIRQVMVLSQPFDPSTMEYVLQSLAGIPGSEAKDRLTLFVKELGPDKALTGSLLARPQILDQLRKTYGDGEARLLCFVSTEQEKQLAETLGVALHANDPEMDYLGTKPGGREVFAEAGVPFPDGIPEQKSVRGLAEEVAKLLERHPETKKVVVKLREGTSGNGNAMLDVSSLTRDLPKSTEEIAAKLEAMIPEMRLQGSEMNWPTYERKIGELGVIAELFVEGKINTSPSVQGRVHPDGRVEVISTHEQVLGGEDGQTYLGASFPAKEDYRQELQEYGERVGKVLAERGAKGRYAVDFMAVDRGPDAEKRWDLQAIEINLREGGTTHPFETMRVLTGGSLDAATGQFLASDGTPKSYVVSDNVKSKQYKGLTPADAADIAQRHGLHFDPETQEGIAFHMLGLLRDHGKVGVTCIANSGEKAQKLYEATVAALDKETAVNARKAGVEPAKLPEPQPQDGSAKSTPLFLVSDNQIRMRPKGSLFSDWTRSVAFAPDRPLLATAVNNRGSYAIHVHDRRNGESVQTLSGPTMPIRELAFGTGEKLAAAAADGSVTVWSTRTGEELWRKKEEAMVNAVAFSGNGEHVASGDTAGRLTVRNAKTGETVFKTRADHGWVRSVAFTPDSNSVALGAADGSVKLYELGSGELKATFEGHPVGAYNLAFSDDGRLLAVSAGDGSLSIWHVKEKKLLHHLEREWKTSRAAFAPGGERVAFGSSDGSVRIYDWKAGTETKIRNFDSTPTTLDQPSQRGPVVWGEGGHTLSAFSADGSLHEWTFA